MNPSQQAKLLLCIAVNAAAFCCVLTANADENNTLVKNEQTLINHGEFQMKRMLSDRLQMNLFLNSRRETVYVDTTDTIYQWMVRRYAGVVTGGRIFWDPVLPKGFNADHSTPIMGDPATIRIANPSVEEAPVNTRFEKQWFWAVFEMHNLENSRGFADLFTRVARDQISREKFIQASAHLEYLAMKRTLKFYHNTWCKWAATSSFVTDLSIWQGGALPEFESWLQLFKKSDSKYPEVPFGATYTWAATEYKKYLSLENKANVQVQEGQKRSGSTGAAKEEVKKNAQQ